MFTMEWFERIGLNDKQKKLYLHLLENGALTASQLADELKEQRTNIYLITDELVALDLIERNTRQPVARFMAANPARLQQLIAKQQQDLAVSAKQLRKILPELQGRYVLSSQKPGFAYYEGIKGYGLALDDMIRSGQEVCVFGSSNVSVARPDAWTL
ncbi:MAG: helix-turn-helix domain-containing protein [Candidatus Saccharimonadales bacterium]